MTVLGRIQKKDAKGAGEQDGAEAQWLEIRSRPGLSGFVQCFTMDLAGRRLFGLYRSCFFSSDFTRSICSVVRHSLSIAFPPPLLDVSLPLHRPPCRSRQRTTGRAKDGIPTRSLRSSRTVLAADCGLPRLFRARSSSTGAPAAASLSRRSSPPGASSAVCPPGIQSQDTSSYETPGMVC